MLGGGDVARLPGPVKNMPNPSMAREHGPGDFVFGK